MQLWLAGGIAVLWLIFAAGCTSRESPDQAGNPPPGGGPLPLDSPQPMAVVEETEAFLGILDPSEKVEKLFTIRNQGKAPLVLSRGGTSCKCTMSTLPDEPVLPGKAAIVRVSTKSEETEGTFDHNATILTNDPENQRIQLRISGKFAKVIAFDPPQLILPSLNREKPTEISALVYSELFRTFTLASVESSLRGLSWEVEPAEESVLESLEARCGYRLRLRFPPSKETGSFWETLKVTACPDDDPIEVREATCQIAGSSQPRAQMSGRNFAPDKVLRLGNVRRWQGAKERLTLTIHDEHRNLKIEAIEKDPEFLEVEIVPMVPEKPESGHYWVNVAVPRDAPTSNYMGSKKGEVRIVTDHPAMPVMSFSVQFAVTSS
ncbi:MAG: DUF1573 domain-containing protein [Thermoguttaceae bacterium]